MARRPFQRKLRVGRKSCWVQPQYGWHKDFSSKRLEFLHVSDLRGIWEADILLYCLKEFVWQEVKLRVEVEMHPQYAKALEREQTYMAARVVGRYNRLFKGSYRVKIL